MIVNSPKDAQITLLNENDLEVLAILAAKNIK